MIYFFHYLNGSEGSMVGADYIPRVGEHIRISTDLLPEENGIYEVKWILYSVPSTPGHQRIDIYGKKIGELPGTLSYDAVADIIYN
jgi:hypothetical protein